MSLRAGRSRSPPFSERGGSHAPQAPCCAQSCCCDVCQSNREVDPRPGKKTAAAKAQPSGHARLNRHRLRSMPLLIC